MGMSCEELCHQLGPMGPVIMVIVLALYAWAKDRYAKEQAKDAAEQRIQNAKLVAQHEATAHKVENAALKAEIASLRPPAASSSSSPALAPVVVPVASPPSDLLSAQVDGQSDRETKP